MILGTASGPSFQRSFPLGSVRLLEQLTPADPPTPENLASGRAWLREFLKTEVRPVLAQALAAFQSAPIQLIGTGGTVTILSRMLLGQINFDRLAMEATPIRRDYIGSQTERLWSLSMADRRRIPGLPANRADVILTGIAIYEAIMNEFNFEELTVSTRGLRFGALLEGISVPAQP